MPPKKKGKKKGKKSKKSDTPAVQFDYEPPADLDEQYVILNIRLISWTYLDFTFKTSTRTHLYTVIERISEQHRGTIQGIELFRETRAPNTQLKDEFATLEQLGIKGGTKDNPPTVTILYDFKADHIPQSVDVFFSNPDIPDRVSTEV
ncbi:hypothetical protein BLNAU_8290 [Blattamonas nauphoetae]|uniref:Uncharacterized protein n=1 Tax=Blattamonas nauphoetae TaxID=2049346 RepID=A0ABQ9XYT8_9EUKA|nr:hypothetical protein BLNAU_8290 [Blattamonas nauphoetae]